MNRVEEKLAIIAVGPVLIFLITYLLELVSFALLGRQINSLFLLAFAASLFLPRILFGIKSAQTALFSLVGSVFLIAVSFSISSQFYDTSYDGQTYHQLAVSYLSEGWNFFTGNRDLISNLKPEYQLPLLHYPKFPWLVESIIYGVTGSIEGAKSLNLTLFLCAGIFTYVAAQQLNFPKLTRSLFAIALSLNPVSICQLWTSYIDGTLASISLFMFAALGLLFSTRRTVWAHVAGLCALILLHIKFTAISVLVSVSFVLFIGVLRRSPICKISFKIFSIYLFLAGAVVGFHPYVTNILMTGNPIYPIAGYSPLGSTPPPDNWPVFPFVQGQQPKVLTELPGPVKTTLSLLSKAADPLNPDEDYKCFYQLKFTDFSRYTVPDIRLGGFGPLYAFSLVASFFAFANCRQDNIGVWLKVLGAAIILSSLLNPESWWSRYCPQLWMLPLLFAAVGRSPKLLQGISLILIVGSMTILVINTESAYLESRKVQDTLTSLEQFRGRTLPGETFSFYSNDLRLRKLDIHLSQPVECLNKVYFAGSPAYVCLPPT